MEFIRDVLKIKGKVVPEGGKVKEWESRNKGGT